MSRVAAYEEVNCRSALNRVQGMSFSWSLNPYQGCAHGCHYCYARRYHGLREQDPHAGFGSKISVKSNIERVLRRELSRPKWRREQVAIGTATDPYQPLEGRYRLTQACLRALHDHKTPVSVVTKGTLVYRDAELLAAMNQEAGATVVFSLTTLDKERWAELEPGTSPPWQRLRVMQYLRDTGVHVGVLLAPILPGLTDDESNLRAVVSAAADHGAQFLGSQLVYLKQAAKEHFYQYLERKHPSLLAEYRRLYPNDYAPKRFSRRIQGTVEAIKQDHDLMDQPQPLRPGIRQLSFL
ncbi:MAG: radical SAM protein [Anaerolineales bacterium]